MQILNSAPKFLPGVLILAIFTGCSLLDVRVDRRPAATQQRISQRLLADLPEVSAASRHLEHAQRAGLSTGEKLTSLLAAARNALPPAVRGDGEAQKIYNAAVGQILTLIGARQPSAFAGLTILRAGPALFDPAQADSLIPAASVRISGLHQRTAQAGLGVACTLHFPPDSPALAGQPGIPPHGIFAPGTALLTFRGNAAELRFVRSLQQEQTVIDGRKVRLATDFSAALALQIAAGRNRALDLSSLVLTRQNLGRAGLFQLQPYDPNRIPVIFVHGLMSRPETWTQAYNTLMADPVIRRRYQFWFFLYPTGLPIWQSAAILRAEMDRFHHELERERRNPRLHRTVLIGHSMGGLISSLTIREGGRQLWNQFSDAQIEALNLSPEGRDRLKQLIFYEPRHDISRVIFVATPHRGSRLALNPIASLGARLIRLPDLLNRGDRREVVNAIDTDLRNLFTLPANSIRFLRANSPLLTSIQKLPLVRDTPYHSIMGDRGRGDSPNSSDGVVPYWSSHLETAVSEKIVPSGHGANEDAAAIEEMRRILLEAL